MKKIFAAMLFMIWAAASSAQPVQPAPERSKDYYLDKSKSQKTAAWILLLGGAAVTTAGAVWFSQSFTLFGPTTSEESTAIALTVVGTAAMVGSIPLFIASGRNARKAGDLSLHLQWEKSPFARAGQIGQRPFPALAMKFGVR